MLWQAMAENRSESGGTRSRIEIDAGPRLIDHPSRTYADSRLAPVAGVCAVCILTGGVKRGAVHTRTYVRVPKERVSDEENVVGGGSETNRARHAERRKPARDRPTVPDPWPDWSSWFP